MLNLDAKFKVNANFQELDYFMTFGGFVVAGRFFVPNRLNFCTIMLLSFLFFYLPPRNVGRKRKGQYKSGHIIKLRFTKGLHKGTKISY